MSDDQLSHLSGAEVQSVIYQNKENGYAIARVRVKDEPGQISIVGIMGNWLPVPLLICTVNGPFIQNSDVSLK